MRRQGVAVTSQKAPEPATTATILVMHPASLGRLWERGGCGVFKSIDRGVTWQQLPVAPASVLTLTVSPAGWSRSEAAWERVEG